MNPETAATEEGTVTGRNSMTPGRHVGIAFGPTANNTGRRVRLPLGLLTVNSCARHGSRHGIRSHGPVDVSGAAFSRILTGRRLDLSLDIPGHLRRRNDARRLNIRLHIGSVGSFGPTDLIRRIPRLGGLVRLHSTLMTLGNPLNGTPTFHGTVRNILTSSRSHNHMLNRLNLGTTTRST